MTQNNSNSNGHSKGKGRTGRPKLAISTDLFEDLCRIQCTETEIAGVLRVSVDTLERWCKRTFAGQTFAEAYKRFADVGKMSLRRTQLKVALSGNPTMLIWMGKQMLGQRDKQETEISGPNGGPIQHEFTDDKSAAAFILNSYIDQGLSEIEARTRAVEAGVDPAALPIER